MTPIPLTLFAATSSSCPGRAKWCVQTPPRHPPRFSDWLEETPRLTRFFSQRLAKWFTTLSPKEKAKIIKDVTQLVLSRRTRMCNFLEYKGGFFSAVPNNNYHTAC